jgi:hypothetical protein
MHIISIHEITDHYIFYNYTISQFLHTSVTLQFMEIIFHFTVKQEASTLNTCFPLQLWYSYLMMVAL